MRRLAWILYIGLMLTGCSQKHPKSADVPIKDVPDQVMNVANEKLPGVTFEQAWKTTNGNYEVRGKTKEGKVRDIQISPNGEVVEVD